MKGKAIDIKPPDGWEKRCKQDKVWCQKMMQNIINQGGQPAKTLHLDLGEGEEDGGGGGGGGNPPGGGDVPGQIDGHAGPGGIDELSGKEKVSIEQA